MAILKCVNVLKNMLIMLKRRVMMKEQEDNKKDNEILTEEELIKKYSEISENILILKRLLAFIKHYLYRLLWLPHQ